MNDINYSFIISGLAGLSTMIGTIIIFFRVKNVDKIIGASLAFASGVMITICATDLLPASIDILSNKYATIPIILILSLFLVVGLIISIFINKIVPSNDNNKLFRTGILSMFILMLHNIPEGIATFITANDNIKFGVILALAISFHNIPEGISIAVPIYYSTKSKIKALFYTFVAGFSELVGAILAYFFLLPYINEYVFSALYAIISGLMIHISMYELLPTSFKYSSKGTIAKYIVFGILVMIICHFLI